MNVLPGQMGNPIHQLNRNKLSCGQCWNILAIFGIFHLKGTAIASHDAVVRATRLGTSGLEIVMRRLIAPIAIAFAEKARA